MHIYQWRPSQTKHEMWMIIMVQCISIMDSCLRFCEIWKQNEYNNNSVKQIYKKKILTICNKTYFSI